MKKIVFSGITLGLLGGVLFPSTAHAYIDPGTGSLIYQLLIAALVGGLFALKVFWQRLKKFFSFNKKEETDEKGEI